MFTLLKIRVLRKSYLAIVRRFCCGHPPHLNFPQPPVDPESQAVAKLKQHLVAFAYHDRARFELVRRIFARVPELRRG